MLAVHNHPVGRTFPAPADQLMLRTFSDDVKRPVPGFIFGYTGPFVRAARRILASAGDARLSPGERADEGAGAYQVLLKYATVPARRRPERSQWPVQAGIGRTQVVEAVLCVYKTRPEDFDRAFNLDDEAEDK